MRKCPLVTGECYHVINKSIEGYNIFPQNADFERFILLIRYFNLRHPPDKFSFFITRNSIVRQKGFDYCMHGLERRLGRNTTFFAYCIMPTHFHLLLRQESDNGITTVLKHALNGYARYFNIKYNRHGTLWMSKFKNVLVENDEQLLHLTRYIHLNPTTAELVDNPGKWHYSSYSQYVKWKRKKSDIGIDVSFREIISMSPMQYRKFIFDHKDYQRELAHIKAQILE